MENTHIHSSFDNDLNKLNDNLLKLGNTALEQFDNCINNFGTQNLEEIEKVVGGDTILDDLDDKVPNWFIESSDEDENNLYAVATAISTDMQLSLEKSKMLAINNLACIHLDIEGHEYFALKGAEITIEVSKPVILVEDEKKN